MEESLRSDSLTVGYGHTVVVENVTFSVCSGEILVLIGPNGAGKSTILKSISRQLRPLSGTVYLGKQPLPELTERESARRLSILMTERVEPELMTCEEVVSAGRYPYTGRLGLLTPADWQVVRESMELVHAGELWGKAFRHVSDGQRQRVMLARALCQQPEVLVMDEPTSFLDIRHKLELTSLLKRLARERGIAVVLSLHELELAQKCADRLLCVANGRIDRMGTPEEIFSGGYIEALYNVHSGSYNPLFGSLELEPPAGEPEVFVIGGGGSGISLYRRLQRMGVPFYAGVLSRSDLDYPAAKVLAAEVIEEEAFSPVSDATRQLALARMAHCRAVFCTPERFGVMNEGNRLLMEAARERGILRPAEELEQAFCHPD